MDTVYLAFVVYHPDDPLCRLTFATSPEGALARFTHLMRPYHGVKAWVEWKRRGYVVREISYRLGREIEPVE